MNTFNKTLVDVGMQELGIGIYIGSVQTIIKKETTQVTPTYGSTYHVC